MLRDALEGDFGLSSEKDCESHSVNLFTPRNPLFTERLLLVGDAAGADPLFGESNAILQG
jgi:hypothetical protein